ncbi:hypothetical protein [Gilvimarinus chinensis]|uniref:hypothetical protein n=1 Tax=Gilvimarinus chinensis TaxID=396005 RepID=UPI0003604E78|nr:hypothetical protein [Gilvimarinus chinensis]
MSTVHDLPKTKRKDTLEKYYTIVGNGKLQMKHDTPTKSKTFQKNLRQLIDAKLANRTEKK